MIWCSDKDYSETIINFLIYVQCSILVFLDDTFECVVQTNPVY